MTDPARGRAPEPGQYRDAGNLRARQALHERYGGESESWFRWIFDHLPRRPAATVLEVGAGPGRLWTDNADRVPSGWQATVTDASPGMVAAARAALGRREGFAFAEVDVQDLPFASASFDAVVANHMLYHVPDLARALDEVRRVLRTGGVLLAATNGAGHMRELEELAGVALPPELAALALRREVVAGFTLENGAAILGRAFDRVERHDRDAPLVVPDAEPLVAYLASVGRLRQALDAMPGAARERILTDAVERVRERIRRAGPVTVTRASGVFVAC